MPESRTPKNMEEAPETRIEINKRIYWLASKLCSGGPMPHTFGDAEDARELVTKGGGLDLTLDFVKLLLDNACMVHGINMGIKSFDTKLFLLSMLISHRSLENIFIFGAHESRLLDHSIAMLTEYEQIVKLLGEEKKKFHDIPVQCLKTFVENLRKFIDVYASFVVVECDNERMKEEAMLAIDYRFIESGEKSALPFGTSIAQLESFYGKKYGKNQLKAFKRLFKERKYIRNTCTLCSHYFWNEFKAVSGGLCPQSLSQEEIIYQRDVFGDSFVMTSFQLDEKKWDALREELKVREYGGFFSALEEMEYQFLRFISCEPVFVARVKLSLNREVYKSQIQLEGYLPWKQLLVLVHSVMSLIIEKQSTDHKKQTYWCKMKEEMIAGAYKKSDDTDNGLIAACLKFLIEHIVIMRIDYIRTRIVKYSELINQQGPNFRKQKANELLEDDLDAQNIIEKYMGNSIQCCVSMGLLQAKLPTSTTEIQFVLKTLYIYEVFEGGVESKPPIHLYIDWFNIQEMRKVVDCMTNVWTMVTISRYFIPQNCVEQAETEIEASLLEILELPKASWTEKLKVRLMMIVGKYAAFDKIHAVIRFVFLWEKTNAKGDPLLKLIRSRILDLWKRLLLTNEDPSPKSLLISPIIIRKSKSCTDATKKMADMNFYSFEDFYLDIVPKCLRTVIA